MCPRRRRLSNPNRSPQAFCTGIRAGAFPHGVSGRSRQAWVMSPSSRGWGLEGRAASRTNATRGPDLQGTTACPAAMSTKGRAAVPGPAVGCGWGGRLGGTETGVRCPISGDAGPERGAARFVSRGAERIGRKLPGPGRETAEGAGARVSRCRERRGERAATPIGEFPGTGRIISPFPLNLRRSGLSREPGTGSRSSFVFVRTVQRGTELRHCPPLKGEALRRLPKKFATRVPRFSAFRRNPVRARFSAEPWLGGPGFTPHL